MLPFVYNKGMNKIKNIKRLLILCIVALVFTSCTNKDIDVKPTKDVTDIKPTTTAAITPESNVDSDNVKDSENLKKKIEDFTEREKYLYENANDTPIQDFTLPDFDGTKHTLSDYKGSIVVLNFWAIGCPPCINELPDFNEVCKQDGVELITVAQKGVLGNNKDESGKFMEQFDAVGLWDEKLDTMNLYPSQYYPHSYIIDRQGIVRFATNALDKETLNELVTFCDEVYN